MTTVVGRYVPSFADADLGMLLGASLNAPYPFHWLELQSIDGDELVCTGAGAELRLPIQRTRHGDRARVTVRDPIFGPLEFAVAPFLTDGGRGIGGPLL